MNAAHVRRRVILALLLGLGLLASSAEAQRGLSLEEQILILTNQERALRRLPPLRVSAQLNQAASVHARNMARANLMTHTLGGQTHADRIRATGYRFRSASENVAQGYASAAQVMRAWMNSPGHRANILSPMNTEIGIGVAPGMKGRLFHCQVFARPR